jgi:hypothetical protein
MLLALRVGVGVTNPVASYPDGLSVGTVDFYMSDEDGNRYLVSNNHVIGESNDANNGDSVVQPGTLDLTGGEFVANPTLADLEGRYRVAEVSAIVDLKYKTPNNIPINHVDAAMARLTDSGRGLEELDQQAFGGSILRVASPYELDDDGAIVGSSRVFKVGRTTGYTEGKVTNLAGVVDIAYGDKDQNVAHFTDQIFIEETDDNVGPFSDSGDSGSGILSNQHEIVGLLFAGSRYRMIANPIANVLDELRSASGIDSLEVVTS